MQLPPLNKSSILDTLRHFGSMQKFRHSFNNASKSGVIAQDTFLRIKYCMWRQSQLNSDGSNRSASKMFILIVGKRNMVFVLVFIFYISALYRIFFNKYTPFFAEKLLHILMLHPTLY